MQCSRRGTIAAGLISRLPTVPDTWQREPQTEKFKENKGRFDGV